jgi:outer membrane protein TolC
MMLNSTARVATLALVAAAAWPAPARAQDAPSGAPTFVQPPVSDPMLAPPEAAPSEIRSWDEAIAMIRRSPEYLTTVESVERSIAQRRIALAAVLPQLSAAGSYVHNFNSATIPLGAVNIVSPAPTVWSVTGAAAWNVLDLRGLHAVGTADRAIDVANLSLADRRRVLASSVVSAMLATLASGRVAELDRVGLRTALERLALTQTRLQFNRGTALDIDRAQQDVAAARAQLINGDESLRQAREALGQALGSATPIAAPADLDLEGFERAVATTCHLDHSIEQRADIAAARGQVDLADRQIDDAKLRFVPSISLGSAAGWASVASLGPQETWSFTAMLNVPLFDGGARYGVLRDAHAAAAQARDALAALRIEAMIETARAARAIGVNTAARDVARQQRELAQRIDARTREGYAKGVGTSLDLVTSAQALRQADINLALLDFQLAQARASAVLANAECFY